MNRKAMSPELSTPKSAGSEKQIETGVVRLLTRGGKTLALAESCTGGCIAHRITNVPGASEIFPGGVVAYSNGVKQTFLGVRPETLKRHGAVSEAVAREMAEGARKKFGADYAIAVTGIAGPGGGTKAKPVGTVFIALAGDFETVVAHNWNCFEREKFKDVTANQALKLLLSQLTQT
jgi:nicotinamide-nucleotide amidase